MQWNNQRVPERPIKSPPDNKKSPPAACLELDTDPPDACSLPTAERSLPTTSGTGPAMAIYELTKRMRKTLIRVIDKKVIVCVGVVSSDFSRFECDGSGKDSVVFFGG